MQNHEIFYPVCAQVFLALIIQYWVVSGRVKAIKKARINPQAIASAERFDEIMKGQEDISDNFENLFEVPVLFFVAAILIFSLQLTDAFYLITGWSFVILRYLHSYIHCTYNRITDRFMVYLLSSAIVWAMWIKIAFQLADYSK